MSGNANVGLHVLNMISLIEQLEKLDCKLEMELSHNLIMQSLPNSFSLFIVNFNMNKMDCELHDMSNLLVDYQNQVDSGKNQGSVLVVGRSNKKMGKGKYKPRKKPFAAKGGVTQPKHKKGDVKVMLSVSSIRRKDTRKGIVVSIDSLRENKQGETFFKNVFMISLIILLILQYGY